MALALNLSLFLLFSMGIKQLYVKALLKLTYSSIFSTLYIAPKFVAFTSDFIHKSKKIGALFSGGLFQVINVNSDELILEAFKLMKENQIGGLPVTEGPTRKIVGNVSMRDIRFLLLKPELFSNFSQLTVLEFLKAIGPTNPISGSKYMAPPITCSTDACLESVIESLAIKMVHRIYVVDGNMSVIGVVTLRDVISCFIYEPPDHFDNYLGFAIEEMLNSS
ncbi:SNF1-related protein kinase regulatory subunit gamma-1-like [Asparagus officinalis]|uniref:SNF1-related protein kinase regulatory subunit gamma-1-like n=1 Tax=Asparagus officinalis TaxID=4686 RepID=UPI00098E4830|nr:SNF1-related protein kinase regulatory subunit gamma-1-like [Asparagus officinalis]